MRPNDIRRSSFLSERTQTFIGPAKPTIQEEYHYVRRQRGTLYDDLRRRTVNPDDDNIDSDLSRYLDRLAMYLDDDEL